MKLPLDPNSKYMEAVDNILLHELAVIPNI